MSDSVLNRGWVGGYYLIRELGRGGSGTVWEASDEAGTHVALKLLHPSLADTEKARARLLREARLVNQIQSDFVARVLDVEAEASSPFVVTELFRGPTLDDKIRQRPLEYWEAAQIGRHLLETLTAVHASGVAHRDLKPSNIILTEDGPVLIDFGIAQGEGDSSLTLTGSITGTPGYVSPELLLSAKPDLPLLQAGDWFAWSALLLKSVTGRPPFGTGKPEVILRAVLDGDADTTGLATNVENAFLDALAATATERPAPDALLNALENPDHTEEDTLVGLKEEATWVGVQAPPTFAPSTDRIDQFAPTENISRNETFSQPLHDTTQPPVPVLYPSTMASEPSRVRKAPFLSAALLATLAWLSVFFGPLWILAGISLLLVAQVFARVSYQVANHQYLARSGYDTRGPVSRALSLTLKTPWNALVAAAMMAPGILAGAVILYGVMTFGTFLASGSFDLFAARNWFLSRPTSLSPSPWLTWFGSWAALMGAFLVPTSRWGRFGFARAFGALAPTSAVRFFLFFLLALIFVAAGFGVAIVT